MKEAIELFSSPALNEEMKKYKKFYKLSLLHGIIKNGEVIGVGKRLRLRVKDQEEKMFKMIDVLLDEVVRQHPAEPRRRDRKPDAARLGYCIVLRPQSSLSLIKVWSHQYAGIKFNAIEANNC